MIDSLAVLATLWVTAALFFWTMVAGGHDTGDDPVPEPGPRPTTTDND